MILEELERELTWWMACEDHQALCPKCWTLYRAQFSDSTTEVRGLMERDSSLLLPIVRENPQNWQTSDGWWWILCEKCDSLISIPINGWNSVVPRDIFAEDHPDHVSCS